MREVGKIEKISQHDHGNKPAGTGEGLPAPFAAYLPTYSTSLKTTVLVSLSELYFDSCLHGSLLMMYQYSMYTSESIMY